MRFYFIILLFFINSCMIYQPIPDYQQENNIANSIMTALEFERQNKFFDAYDLYMELLNAPNINWIEQKQINRRLYLLAEKFHKEALISFIQNDLINSCRYLNTAFMICPAHPKIVNGFHVHELEKNDSLNKISNLYYSLNCLSSVITEFNNIRNKNLKNILRLKVPKINGLPFNIPVIPMTAPIQSPKQSSHIVENIIKGDVAEELTKKSETHVVSSSDKIYNVIVKEKEYKIQEEMEDKKEQKKVVEDSVFTQAGILFKNGSYLEAKKNFELALEKNMNPEKCKEYIEKCNRAYALFSAGIKFFKNLNFQKAIKNFNEVLKINPDDKIARDYLKKYNDHKYQQLFKKAVVNYKNAQFQQAIEDFQMALKIVPESDECHDYIDRAMNMDICLGRAEKFVKKEQFNKGINEYKQALKIDPQYLPVNEMLKNAHLKKGIWLYETDYLASQKEFKAALKYGVCVDCDKYLKGIKGKKSLEKGLVSFEKNEHEKASQEFKNVLKNNPENKDAHRYLYISLFKLALKNYENGRYNEFKNNYLESLIHKSKCNGCPKLIDLYINIENHLKSGVQYLTQNKIYESLKALGPIYIIFPNYKGIKQYMNNAKTLLEVMEKNARNQLVEARQNENDSLINKLGDKIAYVEKSLRFINTLEDLKLLCNSL